MRTGMNVHLTTRAKVSGKVVTDGVGRRYITLEITDDGVVYPAICFFPEDETFLDKLANECERVTREYVGDVPPLEPLSDDCPNCKRDDCECTLSAGMIVGGDA